MKFLPQSSYELETYLGNEQLRNNFIELVQKPSSCINVYKYFDDDQPYEGELVKNEFWMKSLQDFVKIKGSIDAGSPATIRITFLNYPRPFRNLKGASRGPAILVLGLAIGLGLFGLLCEILVITIQGRFSLKALIPLAISAFFYFCWRIEAEHRYKYHLEHIRAIFVESRNP